jgi:hypothetical protein
MGRRDRGAARRSFPYGRASAARRPATALRAPGPAARRGSWSSSPGTRAGLRRRDGLVRRRDGLLRRRGRGRARSRSAAKLLPRPWIGVRAAAAPIPAWGQRLGPGHASRPGSRAVTGGPQVRRSGSMAAPLDRPPPRSRPRPPPPLSLSPPLSSSPSWGGRVGPRQACLWAAARAGCLR